MAGGLMSGIAFGFTIPFTSVVETCLANIVLKYIVMAVAVIASEVPHLRRQSSAASSKPSSS